MKKVIILIGFFFSLSVLSQNKNFLQKKGDSICSNTKEVTFCKAIDFYRNGQYDSCYAYSNKAITLSKNTTEKDFFSCILGYSAFVKGLNKKSLSSILDISEDKDYRQTKNYLLGNIYLRLGKYEEAIEAIQNWLLNSSTASVAIKKVMFHNLAVSYMHIKKYKLAKKFFDKEFQLLNLKDTSAIIKAKMDLANVYYEQYLDDEAIPLFKEAYDLSVTFTDIEMKHNASKNMAIIEKNRKNFEKSVKYFNEYVKWKDSIWNRDRIIELADKDKEVAVAQKDKEIAIQEAEIKQKEAVQRGLLFGASGLLLFIAGLGFFYRKLKKQNAIISKQKEDLNVANKTKDYLFSVVSHDLRSPINTIKRQHLKLQKQLKNKEYDAVFETNNTAIALTESTSHLLNNVLHWSLDQNNQMSFNKDVYPLKPLIEQSVFDFEHIAEAKNIELTTNLDSSLLIKVDKESLKIVLRNLLDNALKYTPEEGKIGVKTFLNNENCIIEIQDTGQGISDEQLTKIKDLEDLTIDKINRSEGVGLGMLLCQTLIKKNHGKLIINSKIGQGTSIQIVLQTVKE
ncbi:tetratricopeptide repeat-containing sensor histidine kinase [Tenacibaculum geojense]|uniref:tetratricopeptide repeat-containing sensor histidine kinase n=1 Tax=Tenacibaculum geojense TaxID=915352 RepID=UPI0036DD1D7F